MSLDKKKDKLLDFNFYNQTINNLKLTMSPQEIQKFLKKQPVIQKKAETFQKSVKPITDNNKPKPVIKTAKPAIIIRSSQISTTTSKVAVNSQLAKTNAKMVAIRAQSTQRFQPSSALRATSHIPQTIQLSQSIFEDQKPRLQGIKLKKSTKKISQKREKLLQQQQDYEPSQQNQNIAQQEIQSNQQQSSVLSEEPKKDSQAKEESQSQSSHEDHMDDEGIIKYFPKQNDYFYPNQDEQKSNQDFMQVMKSVIMFGFGSKYFKMYLRQTNVKVDPGYFLECRPKYYRQVNIVMYKVVQSIQYFLQKDCSLKIRKITMNQYSCIKNDFLNFKVNYKNKHVKTIQKFIKIILNMEDVTLSERKVKALHDYMLEKIDKKFKSQEGIKVKDKELSKKISGPPYTLRKERKLYNAFYKNDQNMFDVKWKSQIQSLFLHYYNQVTSFHYCFQKLKLLYPEYKRQLKPYNLRNHLDRILRMSFGKLRGFIKRASTQLKLPKLSLIDNSVFRKIVGLKDYEKARLILIRLYDLELTEFNCGSFIHRLNESIREFQAYEGLGLIRKQYQENKKGINIIKLRSRLNKMDERQKSVQQLDSDENEQKQETITQEKQRSSIDNGEKQNQQQKEESQVLYEKEPSVLEKVEENELFNKYQHCFQGDD